MKAILLFALKHMFAARAIECQAWFTYSLLDTLV
jgi:hypothetical protein